MSPVDDPWSSQFRKGTVELAVLALLHGEPRYGTQIVTALEGHPALAITSGTLYPLLSRLRKAGWVVTRWEESPVGPPRKYYSLTKDGEATLIEMARAWRSVTRAVETLIEGETP